MSSEFRSFLVNVGALALLVGVLVVITNLKNIVPATTLTATSLTPQTQTASVETSSVAPPVATSSTSVVPKKPVSSTHTSSSAPQTPAKQPSTPAQDPQASSTQQTASDQVTRIQNPYPFPAESFDDINVAARGALVNILCIPQGASLSPISGSGVIIDPRGVILTNAHVAQYVLLSQDEQLSLHCSVRTGSPATAHWTPSVLFMPPIWVNEHAVDISAQHPTGTGEHDYALLLITNSLDGSPLPASFPSLPIDTREGVTFIDDQILAASYPAEFLGGIAAENDLYANSSVTTVKQLLTFGSGTIDVLSLGGIIEAQSGSSGGSVVNAWGRLVGIITTTSEGATTADRDLRAIALSYIDTDMKAQSGYSLEDLLAGNVAAEAADFAVTVAPTLTSRLVAQIK